MIMDENQPVHVPEKWSGEDQNVADMEEDPGGAGGHRLQEQLAPQVVPFVGSLRGSRLMWATLAR